MLAIYVPLTTQYRECRYEVEFGKLPFLNEMSFANVQGIGSIPFARLERKLGQLPPDLMAKTKEAIRFALEV